MSSWFLEEATLLSQQVLLSMTLAFVLDNALTTNGVSHRCHSIVYLLRLTLLVTPVVPFPLVSHFLLEQDKVTLSFTTIGLFMEAYSRRLLQSHKSYVFTSVEVHRKFLATIDALKCSAPI